MRSYLKRVFRETFGIISREFPAAGAHYQVVKRPGRVVLIFRAPEAGNMVLEVPLTARNAWLLGGKLMDTATEVSQEEV